MTRSILAAPSLPQPFLQRGGRHLRAILDDARASWTIQQERLEPGHLFGPKSLAFLVATAGLEGLFGTLDAERGVAQEDEAWRCVLRSLRGAPVGLGEWLHALHGVDLEELRIDDVPGALGSAAPARARVRIRSRSGVDRSAVLRSVRELLRADLELEEGDVIWRVAP